MCDRCEATVDRRGFLRRALVGGAALAGGVLLPEMAGANALPPLESVGIGEDRLPAPRAVPEPEAATPRAAPPRGVRLPRIVTRAEWGADESIRTSERAYAPVRKLIVHHTASPTNPRDPVDWVRKTYEFHVLGRGYSDVGYNFLIDHRGNVYEGRWARDYAPGEAHDGANPNELGVIGGHALNMNTGSVGICLIGDFTVGRPTAAAMNSLVQLLAWECAVHKIDPMGSDRYVSITGKDVSFPNICGHKDVGLTICPGPNVFNQFPAVRKTIRSMVGSFPAQTLNLAPLIRYNYSRPATGTASSSPSVVGYRILTSNGSVASLGKAAKNRSPRDEGVTDAIALAPAPGTGGYYSLDQRGGVLAFGTAKWFGSLRSKGSRQRPVDLAATPSGDGYWVLAANGGVFAFGGATWFGSLSSQSGRLDVRKIRPTPSGRGYWILAGNGRVYAFGDAPKAGSPADHRRSDVVDLAPTATGKGYWVLMADGGVYAFGDAQHAGDVQRRMRTPIGIVGATNGRGYQVLGADGTVIALGKVATFGGVRAGKALAIAAVVA